MCDMPITGHAVERGAPESGPEHGSQGGAQSSSWALQGPGVGDVCGPGPPTVHRRPRWLPAATGSSATEGLNFSLINLFFNVQSASDRMGVGAPTPAQLEPLGSVPCLRTGVLLAQSRPASSVQSKGSTAQVLCSQVPCGASAEALHPGHETQEILGTALLCFAGPQWPPRCRRRATENALAGCGQPGSWTFRWGKQFLSS